MMRRAGVEVKSPAVIYVIGAFLGRHFWTEMCDGMRHRRFLATSTIVKRHAIRRP